MSGSAIFHRLRRILRIAVHCERTGQPAREALEELDYLQVKARERRRFLTAIGAGAAVSTIPAGMRRTLAAPNVSGGVAIVGAGLAGLTCAYTLAGKGVRADVFEASERAGGRCFSLYNFFPGQVAERGGEFIDTGHVTMRGFANAFGLSLEAVSKLPGDVFYYVNGLHYDEAQVVEVVQVEHLEVGPGHPERRELAQAVDRLLDRAAQLVGPQAVRVLSDRLGPAADLGIVTPDAEHERCGVHEVTRVPPGVLAGAAYPVELGPGRGHVDERHVELVRVARREPGCAAGAEASDDDRRTGRLRRLGQGR